MSAVDVLKKLEWCRPYSYDTGWASCPICGGIRPGWGADEAGILPDNQGHRPNCALAEAIKESKYGCWYDLEPDSEPDVCVLDYNMPGDCPYALKLVKEGRDKTACKYWRPLK